MPIAGRYVVVGCRDAGPAVVKFVWVDHGGHNHGGHIELQSVARRRRVSAGSDHGGAREPAEAQRCPSKARGLVVLDVAQRDEDLS